VKPLWLAVALLAPSPARADDIWKTVEKHDRSRLRASVSIGVSDRQVLAYGRSFDFVTTSGKTLSLDGAALGAMQDVGVDLGVRVAFLGPAYAGFEVTLGGLAVSSAKDKSQSLFVVGGPRFAMGAAGVLGVTCLRRGRLQVGLEIVGGGWATTFFLYREKGGGYTGRRETYGEGIVEPRARVDFWIDRRSTLGVWAGTDLVVPGEAAFGATFDVHFGARR